LFIIFIFFHVLTKMSSGPLGKDMKKLANELDVTDNQCCTSLSDRDG
jgi:hypothetical protein